METIQIDILNPKAKKLLRNLADLNLIKINKEKEKTDFWLDLSDDQKAEVEISRKQVKNGETEDWDSIIKRVS